MLCCVNDIKKVRIESIETTKEKIIIHKIAYASKKVRNAYSDKMTPNCPWKLGVVASFSAGVAPSLFPFKFVVVDCWSSKSVWANLQEQSWRDNKISYWET